jgi:hypothetical protein
VNVSFFEQMAGGTYTDIKKHQIRVKMLNNPNYRKGEMPCLKTDVLMEDSRRVISGRRSHVGNNLRPTNHSMTAESE